MVSFIKTNANMSEDYIKSLKTTWKAVHDEAIKQGLILSYKILVGTAANPEDWDIMLWPSTRISQVWTEQKISGMPLKRRLWAMAMRRKN